MSTITLTQETVDGLYDDIIDILPGVNFDGTYGDGTPETYAAIYEQAFGKARNVAFRAIKLLREQLASQCGENKPGAHH